MGVFTFLPYPVIITVVVNVMLCSACIVLLSKIFIFENGGILAHLCYCNKALHCSVCGFDLLVSAVCHRRHAKHLTLTHLASSLGSLLIGYRVRNLACFNAKRVLPLHPFIIFQKELKFDSEHKWTFCRSFLHWQALTEIKKVFTLFKSINKTQIRDLKAQERGLDIFGIPDIP